MMSAIDSLVDRLAKSSPRLAENIETVLREGLRPKPQTMSDNAIIKAATRAVSRWLTPTSGIVINKDTMPEGKFNYIWHVCREGEPLITVNSSELLHIIQDDKLLVDAVMESRLPLEFHTAFISFIFRAEMDVPGWRMLFWMLAAGALPLVLSTTDRDFDTINILVG